MMNRRAVIGGAVALAIVVILGTLYVMVTLVSRPLRRLSDTIAEMAGGRLDVALDHGDRRDEVGLLAGSVTRLRDQLLAAEQAKQGKELEEKVKRDIAAAQQAQADALNKAEQEVSQ